MVKVVLGCIDVPHKHRSTRKIYKHNDGVCVGCRSLSPPLGGESDTDV